jgi:hypothetical protein
MALYHCYKVGAYGKRIAAGNFQGFEDDILAMAHADRLAAEGHWRGMELWQGARKLDWPESRP